MDSLGGLVGLVMETGVNDRHGATERIGAAEITFTDAHLLNELGVLGIQLNIRELDQFVQALDNTPLEGVQEHLQGIVQDPLASTNEL